MKKELSKTEAKAKIEQFFSKQDFSPKQLRKIKRIAMKFNIKLGAKRKLFCKKCLSPLSGKLTITNVHRTVGCKNCGFKNKARLF